MARTFSSVTFEAEHVTEIHRTLENDHTVTEVELPGVVNLYAVFDGGRVLMDQIKAPVVLEAIERAQKAQKAAADKQAAADQQAAEQRAAQQAQQAAEQRAAQQAADAQAAQQAQQQAAEQRAAQQAADAQAAQQAQQQAAEQSQSDGEQSQPTG